MRKIYILIGFLTILLILTNINFISAEDAIRIPLNSTKIIEPSRGPEVGVAKVAAPSRFIETVSLNKQEFKEKADEELVGKLGETYFKKHFNHKETKVMNNFVCMKYEYNYNIYNTNMLICYDSKKELKPQMNSILDYAQDINFNEEDALLKADNLGLPSEKNIKLIYDSLHQTLGWKITWKHEPTEEERIQEVIEGYAFSVKDGEILKTYRFGFEPMEELNLYGDEEDKFTKISFLKKIKNFFADILKWFK